MTPAERVVFVLHDVFRSTFSEPATSARRRIDASRAPQSPTAQRPGLVPEFARAWQAKDIGALIALLDPDATAVGDGGGLITALLHPVDGAEQIARFFADRNSPGDLPRRPRLPRRWTKGSPSRGRRRARTPAGG
ncbi:hypothetical protein AB0M38_07135 [Streptomyces sp. NPDC051742]|uniref:hypothetical protein n=1 Tax=unclassified Streptomyces TaxID=2593676 RepID=UPI003433157D